MFLCVGISNESGYGSMSRRSNRLRPDLDEDVFTRVNSSRVSLYFGISELYVLHCDLHCVL